MITRWSKRVDHNSVYKLPDVWLWNKWSPNSAMFSALYLLLCVCPPLLMLILEQFQFNLSGKPYFGQGKVMEMNVCVCACVRVSVLNLLCFLRCAGMKLSASFSPSPMRCQHAYSCCGSFYAQYKFSSIHSFICWTLPGAFCVQQASGLLLQLTAGEAIPLDPFTAYSVAAQVCTGGGCTNSSAVSAKTAAARPAGLKPLTVGSGNSTAIPLQWEFPSRPNGDILK